jgi:hypothetical protein
MQLRALKVLEQICSERRRADRVPLTLPGRYMLGDRYEYPCWTVDISPAGVAIQGLKRGTIGERIVAYIDQIGRVEGMVARHFDNNFAVQMHSSETKREKIAKKIAWLTDHQRLGTPDNRQSERIAPRNWRTTLRTPDGREYIAAVLDVGLPGAALNVDATPPIGTPVTIGHTSGQVVRHFDGGIAVAFDNQLSADILIEPKHFDEQRVYL